MFLLRITHEEIDQNEARLCCHPGSNDGVDLFTNGFFQSPTRDARL